MQFAVLAMTHMCIPKPSHPEAEGGWKKVARGEKKGVGVKNKWSGG
jgi:hypothetical protein